MTRKLMALFIVLVLICSFGLTGCNNSALTLNVYN